MGTFRIVVWLIVIWFCAPSTAQAQLPEVKVRAKAFRSSWPDSARQAIRDSLSVARRRWESTRPERYDLAVMNGPSMIAFINDSRYDGHRRTTRIVGDSITSIMFERAPEYARSTQWVHITIDKVFLYLERTVADSSRQIDRLEIDPTFGYPKRWRTDDARNGYGYNMSDGNDGGEVVLFRSDPKDVRCRMWRRLIRRCN